MQKPQLIDSRYELHQLLEQSDTTKIYSAFDTKLQRLVTLKILTKNNLSTKEAQAIAQLKHHNIVTVFDYGANYIAMEHIAGQNLARYCKAQKNIPIKWVVNTIQQIADALYHAHRENIIHRDLKPTNIIICSGIPKITDFGQAKYLDETTSGDIVRGTLPYMAPEQLQENPEIDQRTDIYAVGIIFYELLTKQNPFADVTLASTNRIYEEVPLLPCRIDKSIPRYLQKICMKCLEKKKKRRYQSARTLARDLNKFANRKAPIWLLFIPLLLLNAYQYAAGKQVQQIPVTKVQSMDKYLTYYPIVQKYDWRMIAQENKTVQVASYSKFLLNYAMSINEANKRQEIISAAIAIIQKQINANSKDADIRFLRFLYYLAHRISPQSSLRKKAQSLLVASASPQHEIEYYSNAVISLYQSKTNKLQKTLQLVNRGIEECRSFVFLYEIKATILHLMSQHTDALQCYTTALQYEPHNPFILCARAEYFYKTSNLSAAITDVQMALHYGITTAQIWYLHGRLLKQQQQYEKALTSFTVALQLGYVAEKCYYQRQSLYRKQQQFSKALKDCDALLALEKRSAYYIARAEVYLQLNQLQDTIHDLEAAHLLNPEDRTVILRIANTYKKLGNIDKATFWLQKYTKK